jgi:uncharacterized membrane protein/ketosteroid isomerase-like protein
MIEIVPNWHPIWVHFAIALLITASGVYVLFGWNSGRAGAGMPAALIVSRWLLWLGVLAALTAVLTGLWAGNSVRHDELGHANMLVHRNWAIASTVLFGLVALVELLRRSRTRASVVSALLLLAGSAAIAKTGLEGAENVYEHGLGVQRLPQTEGEGHGHEHGSHDHSGHQEDGAEPDAAPSGAGKDTDGHDHEHSGVDHESDAASGSDAAAPTHPAARVATELSRALAGGNGEAVRSLMSEDVQIFESGDVEASLEEYAGHHLPSDMAFMGAMESKTLSRRVIDDGDMATVLTRSRLKGRYKDRDIDRVTTETLVLRKVAGAWKIVHVHWSSQ